MKFFKRLGFCAIAFTLMTSFVQNPINSNAIGSDEASWIETVDSLDYDTWRQDIKYDYPIKEWLEFYEDLSFYDQGTITPFYFRPERGMEGPKKDGSQSYTVRRYGSLIYAMSKMMVASGAATEFDGENPNGINPNILYHATVLTDESKLDGKKYLKPNILSGIGDNANTINIYYCETGTVQGWHDNPEAFMDTISLYWGTNITLENSESISKLDDTAKEAIIKEYLDSGKYVIVAAKNYKYFDYDTGMVTDGNQNAKHSVFLTGYTEDANTGEISFEMDDSISPITDLTSMYPLKDIVKISVFNPTPSIESRLEFYKDMYVSEPWYLKLINSTLLISESQVKLVPLTKVDCETGTGSTIVVNNANKVAESISGADLSKDIVTVEIDTRIINDTKQLMKAMHDAVKSETAVIDVGFRSIEDQNKLYAQLQTTYGDDVDKRCAKGGESEHNAAIGLDFKVEGVEDFSTTKSYKWLCQHAHEYGFILRYPNSSKASETTGKDFIPSHWRYIGKEHATEFIKFINASYKENADGTLSNVEAYTNISYNEKVYEDYYLDVVLPLYTNADLSGVNNIDDLDKIGKGKPKYSDATLRRVNYLLRHPVKAIGNYLAGLCQMAHNAIAVGDTGNILNITWLLSWDTVHKIIFPYMIVSVIVVCIALVLRYLKYMISSHDSVMAILRDSGSYIVVSIVPVLLIAFVGNCLDGLTGIITKDMSGKIVILEATYKEPEVNNDEVITSWELITDEDLARSLFRETFINSENGKSYEFATVQLPIGYEKDGIIYKTMTITELYETVSYKNIISDMTGQRLSNEDGAVQEDATFYNTTKDVTLDMIKDAKVDKAAPKYLYYSCNEFVPVNYDKYSDSVFYYFYDWIKYQYLAYQAHTTNEKSRVLSNFAKGFVLPGEDFDENLFTVETPGMYEDTSFNNYIDRIEMLEKMYLSNAHSGVYLMYNDMSYVRNNSIYYNDIFGLSYLFNMTTEKSSGNYDMVDIYYKDTQNIDVWAGVNRVNYINTMPNFDAFRDKIKDGDYSYVTIPPLTNIIGSPAWNVYRDSVYLRDKHENGMAYYTFTPSYLAKRFDQPLDTPVSVTSEGRIPWRLYASNGLLHDAYKDKTVRWTKLEQQLCALNESIYKDAHELSEYMPGQITDDVMIFVVALAATTRFNEMFDRYAHPVYPKGIDTKNLDMDKIIRLTYADTLIGNESLDTMYMIYDSPGGLAVVLIVLISELLILVASATRAMLLVMFFIGVVLLTLNYLRGKMPLRSNLFTGVVWQFASLLAMHALLIGANMLIFNILIEQDSAAMRVLVSILGMFLYFIVAVVNLAMLKVFIQDIKNFGGVTLKKAVLTVKTQIDLADSETTKEQTQIDMENAELKLQKKEERRQLNREKLERRLENRMHKLEKQTDKDKRKIKKVRGTVSTKNSSSQKRYTATYRGSKKPAQTKTKKKK